MAKAPVSATRQEIGIRIRIRAARFAVFNNDRTIRKKIVETETLPDEFGTQQGKRKLLSANENDPILTLVHVS